MPVINVKWDATSLTCKLYRCLSVRQEQLPGHAGHLHPGQTFVHASIETYGHLGRPNVWYIRTLRYITSAYYPAGARGSLLASAHRELSVTFVQSQGYVDLSWSLLLTRASWVHFLHGW
jgi:hypothetical protein